MDDNTLINNLKADSKDHKQNCYYGILWEIQLTLIFALYLLIKEQLEKYVIYV